MDYIVYFISSSGERRYIDTVSSEDIWPDVWPEAARVIQRFCEERGYKIPYFRFHHDTKLGEIHIDAGSWSEFFVIRLPHRIDPFRSDQFLIEP